MQHDIRNLFKDDDVSSKTLPKSHKVEFLKKLKKSQNTKTKHFNYKFIYKSVAILILLFTIGLVLYNQPPKINSEIIKKSTLELQIKTIEQQYLTDIDKEWQKFLALTKDRKLIKRYQKKLNNLDNDYKEISIQFSKDTSSILIIEALIKNLQMRLQLLKDIQEHITLLNPQNKQYETTI